VWKPGGVGNSKKTASPALIVRVPGKKDWRSIRFSSSMPATRTRQSRVPSGRSPGCGIAAAGAPEACPSRAPCLPPCGRSPGWPGAPAAVVEARVAMAPAPIAPSPTTPSPSPASSRSASRRGTSPERYRPRISIAVSCCFRSMSFMVGFLRLLIAEIALPR
jgi:hypothetical protein